MKMLIIIFTGEMFFRGDGFRQGFHMFKSIFQGFTTETFKDGTLLTLGLDQNDFRIIIIGCMIAFFADLIKEYVLKRNKNVSKNSGSARLKKHLFLENGSFVMVLLWQF